MSILLILGIICIIGAAVLALLAFLPGGHASEDEDDGDGTEG